MLLTFSPMHPVPDQAFQQFGQSVQIPIRKCQSSILQIHSTSPIANERIVCLET